MSTKKKDGEANEKKKGSKENPVTFVVGGGTKNASKAAKKLLGVDDKSEETVIEIISATIKDELCNYGYEITQGMGKGAKHNVQGPGIIYPEMGKAFSKLNVHLALIDDVFTTAGIEVEKANEKNGDPLTLNYTVTGFVITGGKSNESVVLKGKKRVDMASDRIELKTPKIPMDNLSSYKYYKELKTAVEKCRKEVLEYHNGKYTEIHPEEKDDPNQLSIDIDANVMAGVNDMDTHFEGAKVE